MLASRYGDKKAKTFGLEVLRRQEAEAVRPADDPSRGDCYTFVAIERHSKLVLQITMGKRDQWTTDVFVEGVRHATRGQFQITTDGFAPYRSAVVTTLHDRLTGFAQLIKVYRSNQDGEKATAPPRWLRWR